MKKLILTIAMLATVPAAAASASTEPTKPCTEVADLELKMMGMGSYEHPVLGVDKWSPLNEANEFNFKGPNVFMQTHLNKKTFGTQNIFVEGSDFTGKRYFKGVSIDDNCRIKSFNVSLVWDKDKTVIVTPAQCKKLTAEPDPGERLKQATTISANDPSFANRIESLCKSYQPLFPQDPAPADGKVPTGDATGQ